MMCCNDLIRSHTWKIEMFFKAIVSQAPEMTAVIDPNAATDADYAFLHRLFTEKKQAIISAASETQKSSIKELLDTITQYRRIFSHYLCACITHEDISSYLGMNYSKSDTPATIRITIECNNQLYEHALTATSVELQPIVQKIMDKLNKYEAKTMKKPKKQAEKVDNTVFGKKLEPLMEQQRATKPHLKIPEFLQDCITHLLLKGLCIQRSVLHCLGLAEEGIFKVPGDKKEIDNLKQTVDQGEKIDFTKIKDLHVITGLIKLFLKQIPGSVMTSSLYDMFVILPRTQSPSDYRHKVKNLINELPQANRDVLEAVLHLFWQVSNNATRNTMNATNLAQAISSSLLSARDNTDISTGEANAQISVLATMISDYEFLFQVKDFQRNEHSNNSVGVDRERRGEADSAHVEAENCGAHEIHLHDGTT